MTEEQERALDKALQSGEQPSDPDLASLVGGADVLRKHLAVPSPDASRERSMFVHGLAARRRSFLPLRFVMPAAAVVVGLLVLVGFGRTASPGQPLYTVREALASVGLARTTYDEIDYRMTSARENLNEARSVGLGAPAESRTLLLAAIGDLEGARALTDELPRDERAEHLDEIGSLEERAVDMLVRIEEGGEDGEDSSGPGSGDPDDDSDDDNSGPGSGDDDDSDDDSGSGRDDSGGDDSGSDDRGDDDSGSDGDGDDSGNGGSGSDDSGSGDDN
ncbi:MAG: hypothetical protein M3174_02310 [Actinomycetota bacterium]|nr:hypothetical protein [Actinomycetota bacterium]